METRRKNRIIEGDVIDILPELRTSEEIFDVIIADPPYNIGKDFGNNNDRLPLDEYIEWVGEWISECFNLLAPDGLIYLYGLPEIMARISALYPVNEQRWLVWHYTNKTVAQSRFWQRSHETILCLWKTGENRPSLEVDQIREPYTAHFLSMAGKTRPATPSRYSRLERTLHYNAHKGGALPRDVMKIPALSGGAGHSERWFLCRSCDRTLYPPADLNDHRGHDTFKHPTQKPMKLTRRLIKSRIKGKDGSVLIPFAGSGSECVVAQELGVDYLGIELNPEYVEFAIEWLARSRT